RAMPDVKLPGSRPWRRGMKLTATVLCESHYAAALHGSILYQGRQEMKDMPEGFARRIVTDRRARRVSMVRTLCIGFVIALGLLFWAVSARAGERAVKSLLEMRHQN